MVIATKPMSRLKARTRTASATRPSSVTIWYRPPSGVAGSSTGLLHDRAVRLLSGFEPDLLAEGLGFGVAEDLRA